MVQLEVYHVSDMVSLKYRPENYFAWRLLAIGITYEGQCFGIKPALDHGGIQTVPSGVSKPFQENERISLAEGPFQVDMPLQFDFTSKLCASNKVPSKLSEVERSEPGPNRTSNMQSSPCVL